MENSPKTISFRADDNTFSKLEKLKSEIFKNEEMSNSEVLRHAVDFLASNYKKEILDLNDFLGMAKSYVTTAFLLASDNNADIKILSDLLFAIDRVDEEFNPEEVKELGSLYNEDEPITVARLIRFKHKSTPITFLGKMGIPEEDYQELSDDELADFILEKFKDKEFKEQARLLFLIKS
jgi:hypothetical protein